MTSERALRELIRMVPENEKGNFLFEKKYKDVMEEYISVLTVNDENTSIIGVKGTGSEPACETGIGRRSIGRESRTVFKKRRRRRDHPIVQGKKNPVLPDKSRDHGLHDKYPPRTGGDLQR